MIMLLMLLLLIQLFTVQDQASSPAAPVEVLELEVLALEYKPRRVRDPRTAPPPGPVYRENISGQRKETSRTGQPTIESRSRELREIGRTVQQPQPPAVTRSTPWYSYEFRARVKNTSPKKIKFILWEYLLLDDSGATVNSRRLFRCVGTVKPGAIKVLRASTSSPPSRIVDANTSEKQKAVVNRVDYSDGSTWTRDGWKQDNTAEADAFQHRPYHCVVVSR